MHRMLNKLFYSVAYRIPFNLNSIQDILYTMLACMYTLEEPNFVPVRIVRHYTDVHTSRCIYGADNLLAGNICCFFICLKFDF